MYHIREALILYIWDLGTIDGWPDISIHTSTDQLMKTRFTIPFLLIMLVLPMRSVVAQCTTSNATSCQCPDGTSDCDLLPDMTLSWYGILNYLNGPNEENGRVYLTLSLIHISEPTRPY